MLVIPMICAYAGGLFVFVSAIATVLVNIYITEAKITDKITGKLFQTYTT